MTEFEEVRRVLDSDLENLEGEVGESYDEMERYAEVASVMELQDGRAKEAEYFRDLAVDTYESFTYAIQMDKGDGEGL